MEGSNPLLKRLMKSANVERGEVFHSSEYARAQNQGIGAASMQSYAERMKIEENRQMVNGYGTSSVVGQAFNNAPKPKVYTPAQNNGSLGGRPMPPKNSGISR